MGGENTFVGCINVKIMLKFSPISWEDKYEST